MSTKDKSQSLADKMDKLTEKFSGSIETAEEITDNDVVEYVEGKVVKSIENSQLTPASEIINLRNMVDDFKFVRETLKENTKNGRKILNAVTLDLLDTEDKDTKRASLIMSFAELNKSVADNIKLYVNSYKEISSVLLNLHKIKDNDPLSGKGINPKPIATSADLIKQLTNKG